MLRICLLVGVRDLVTVENVKLSVVTFHLIPKARPMLSSSNSKSASDFTVKPGRLFKTFIELLLNFVSLKPPFSAFQPVLMLVSKLLPRYSLSG